MIKFSDYVNEANGLTPEDEKIAEGFFSNLEDMFKKEFPNGFFRAQVSNSFGSISMAIRFGLGHFPNNIEENDPMLHRIMIHCNVKEGLAEAENMELSPNGRLYIKPEEGSYLAMQPVKTKLTAVKKGGNIPKFEKKMKTWFPRLRKVFEENKEDIYGVEKIPANLLK
jgi:hypothetical protein